MSVKDTNQKTNVERIGLILRDLNEGDVITMEQIRDRIESRFDSWDLTPYEISSIVRSHYGQWAGTNTFRITRPYKEGYDDVDMEEETGE